MPNHSRDTLATGTLTSISQCHFAWLQRYILLVHTHKASLIRTLCWEVGSKSSSLKSRLCRGQPSPWETRALIWHTDDTLCPPEKNPCCAILPNFGQGSNSYPPSPNCDSQGYRFVFTALSSPWSSSQNLSGRDGLAIHFLRQGELTPRLLHILEDPVALTIAEVVYCEVIPGIVHLGPYLEKGVL